MTLINSSPDKFRPAVEDFLESMTSVFKTPYNLKGDRVGISLKNYGEVLEKYSDPALAELWQRARIKFSGPWPSIKDLADTAGEIYGERVVKETNNISIEIALASPEGQYALKNGAGGSFLNSVKQLGWIPNQELTERIVRQKRYHVSTLDPYWVEVHQRREREMREQHMKPIP